MRKLCLPLTLIAIASAAIAIGCEDGPDQTFSPAPSGAAGNWNNGNVDAAVVTGVGTSFDSGFPTVNAVTLCSTDFKRERWAWMLTQPIQPPRKYAGIDLAKDDLWDGLTIDEAETPPPSATSPEGGLCQSTPFGFQGTCPSGIGGCNGNSWGNASEVGFSWNVSTHILDQMTLNLGYTGSMTTNDYLDHNGEKHHYAIAVGDIYRRDEQPFEINWNSKADRAAKITDIFNATMATYSQAAGIPFNTATCSLNSDCDAPGQKNSCQCVQNAGGTGCVTGTKGQCGVKDCSTDGNCLVYTAGGETIFGIRPMVVYVVGVGGVPQPALSTPTEIYNFFTKWEPYSYLNQLVTLDQDGPTATGVPIGTPKGSTLSCTQHIGQTFADLTTNCVQVTGDIKTNPTNGVDAVNLDKILHGLSHDQEHWTANVLGVNQNFTSGKVASNPDLVVLDTDVPGPTDIAQDYEFDLRARGLIANDYTANGQDDRGSSLMMIEWARILLEDVAKQLSTPGVWNPTGATVKPKKLGDPACIGFDANHVPNYVATNKNPATFGCSGIEGLLIPASYDADGASEFANDPGLLTADPLANLDPTDNYDVNVGFYYGAPVLKPGDLYGALCIDGAQASDCADSLALWSNMLNQVTRVLGDGNVNNLPYELQDRRYYFKWFGTAFVRYLKAYGNYKTAYPATVNNFPDGTVGGGLGPSDVAKTQIDLESLFFDYDVAPGAGGAQTYDKFEYVDRSTIGAGAGGTTNYIPWDFEYGCDLLGGNQRYDNWYRRMDREEIGMYSAMLENKADTAGKENNVNITNLFGSTLLNGNPIAGVPGAWSSYACAIGQGGDPAANCNTNAPLDPNQTGMTPCGAGGTCAGTNICVTGNSYENGQVQACAIPCDFTTYAASGCASPSQVCVNDLAGGGEGCMAAMMDQNVGTPLAKPLLSHYPGAFSRTPFSAGHSPITIAPSDKHAEIGVAHVNLPNFKDGPYTFSPQVPSATADGGIGCPSGWKLAADGNCQAPLNAGTGTLSPNFNPLTPWLEVNPAIGFPIAIDGQRDQWITSGQFDYTGVLESYIVDYRPWVDTLVPGCVDKDADTACSPGFTCNQVSKNCESTDYSVQILGIEGKDFLGDAFLCQDPTTGDVLHVGMYDTALQIVNWLAAHPGNTSPFTSTTASAQSACQITLRRSPYDNYIDQITSKAFGVTVNISGGQGLGRVTDIVLFDPSLVQAL